MHRFLRKALLGAGLIVPVAMAPISLIADDHPRRYHDRDHKDDHEWNEREDRAYNKWLEEKHRAHRKFDRLKEKERREYWKWRHEHPDRD